MLALLLSVRGSVVPVDRMIDRLWRGEPPPCVIASLQSYVSNLRRLIEPDRPPRAPARVLVSCAPGYAVDVCTPAATTDTPTATACPTDVDLFVGREAELRALAQVAGDGPALGWRRARHR